jgi:hypothetical protein
MDNNFWGEVVHRYTRQEAIQDGVLVEVPPDLVREAGIKYHMALTDTAWALVIGRIWDVLMVFRFAAKQTDDGVMFFKVAVWDGTRSIDHALKGHVGPGDEGEPVITIMLPGED